jgi:uncharacterized protein
MSEQAAFQRYEREPAKRAFAAEFRETTYHFKEGSEDKSPTFVLLPTGERCNRVFLVGLLADKKKSEGEAVFYQIKVKDPSGFFFVSAGSYQPEAMHQIASIETPTVEAKPTYVAVIGKPNVFTAPDGRTLVSVRAESVAAVNKQVHDCWILDTATRTLERLEKTDENPDLIKSKEIYKQSSDVWKRMVHEALKTVEI